MICSHSTPDEPDLAIRFQEPYLQGSQNMESTRREVTKSFVHVEADPSKRLVKIRLIAA
jgi:hypothetical protein